MKKLVIGLIIGLIIGMSGTALASSETVQATFQKFKFIVNGVEKQLDADPLVYQGTTYLPVRVVSSLLGYDVTYKADSRTIELTQPTTSNNREANDAPNNNKTIDNSEWISLRELNNIYGVTVRSGFIIEYEGAEITFDAQKVTSEPTSFNTDYGFLRAIKLNGLTYINIKDWESIFEKMKNGQ